MSVTMTSAVKIADAISTEHIKKAAQIPNNIVISKETISILSLKAIFKLTGTVVSNPNGATIRSLSAQEFQTLTTNINTLIKVQKIQALQAQRDALYKQLSDKGIIKQPPVSVKVG